MKAAAFTKTYGDRRVLTMPEMTFEKGVIYAVIGANGSGKTTYARILSGAEPADKRQNPWQKAPEKAGYLPQHPYAFRMSTLANIRLSGHDDERAFRLMEALQIAHLQKERADRLSGGESARMAMARAMMNRFDLLILDEPTAAMDMESTVLAEELISEYRNETNAAIILITHSLAQADRLSDKTLYLHQGELAEYGETEQVLHNPHDSRTKTFIDLYR